MMRLDILTKAVSSVCGGYAPPRSEFTFQTPETLLRILSYPGGLTVLKGMLDICKALTHLANKGEITVACAQATHHRLFGGWVRKGLGGQRERWLYGEFMYDPHFKGLFDLSGITKRDEVFHFASPDMETMGMLLSRAMQELKTEKSATELRKLIDKEANKTWPLSIYKTKVKYPAQN